MWIIYTSDISNHISFLKIHIEVKIPDWTRRAQSNVRHMILTTHTYYQDLPNPPNHRHPSLNYPSSSQGNHQPINHTNHLKDCTSNAHGIPVSHPQILYIARYQQKKRSTFYPEIVLRPKSSPPPRAPIITGGLTSTLLAVCCVNIIKF